MARGSPTAEERLQAALQEFARTGNLRAAARAVGLPESTLRGALTPEQFAQVRAAHVRAREARIADGCQTLGAGISLVQRLLGDETSAGAGLEAKDIAALMNAAARATDSLVGLRADEDRRRLARLTREKVRTETELLRARIDGTLPDQGASPVTTINLHDADAVKRRIRELLDASDAGAPGTPRAAGDAGPAS